MAGSQSSNSQKPEGSWKPVVGYEGTYEVSDRGEVWSVRRPNPNSVYTTVTGRTLVMAHIGGHLMQASINSWGYPVVRLSLSGKTRTRTVHQLVLEAFVGPCPEGMEACHHNDVPTDNRLENLRWDTSKANGEDRRRNASGLPPRTHCKEGHTMAGDNLLRYGRAFRCRTCERARWREKARRKRESHIRES